MCDMRSSESHRNAKDNGLLELIATISKMAPLGRLGEVEDIVGIVSLLAGPEGGWINGQVIRVNGGYI
jgi:3-oxoacyl-[acyl-carrier protein] reductase